MTIISNSFLGFCCVPETKSNKFIVGKWIIILVFITVPLLFSASFSLITLKGGLYRSRGGSVVYAKAKEGLRFKVRDNFTYNESMKLVRIDDELTGLSKDLYNLEPKDTYLHRTTFLEYCIHSEPKDNVLYYNLESRENRTLELPKITIQWKNFEARDILIRYVLKLKFDMETTVHQKTESLVGKPGHGKSTLINFLSTSFSDKNVLTFTGWPKRQMLFIDWPNCISSPKQPWVCSKVEDGLMNWRPPILEPRLYIGFSTDILKSLNYFVKCCPTTYSLKLKLKVAKTNTCQYGTVPILKVLMYPIEKDVIMKWDPCTYDLESRGPSLCKVIPKNCQCK